ncbi:Unannotated [Lentimonas sp. CC4]|nr:Unannotated [Lentimonas sp. CC4]CAA6686788.1 Unannotated [Lentimonas sp. CC6]CAA7075634.1 Unannotated [Lentimonas sp. CC4]CAA7168208.1 Unannotated [Lentimonas sp. CC21]CAA7181641.1 Unannotated [Lentimonas sp. CC8]
MTADRKKLKLPAMSASWVEVPLKGRQPLKVRWDDVSEAEIESSNVVATPKPEAPKVGFTN